MALFLLAAILFYFFYFMAKLIVDYFTKTLAVLAISV